MKKIYQMLSIAVLILIVVSNFVPVSDLFKINSLVALFGFSILAKLEDLKIK